MVEFIVNAPRGVPPWEPLYLAGAGDALGDWRADGVRLDRYEDGTARAHVHLPPAARVRYLVTRGTWRSAESDGLGRERPPRELVSRRDAAVELNVAGWGRDSVRHHPGFRSRHLPHARPVSVYLPPGYDLDPLRRFPVLYLHDGQNLFDAATSYAGVAWRADEVAEREARRHAADPVIVVGVGNTPDRLREYGPRRPDMLAAAGADDSDLSDAYARFLIDELKPFVDAAYRTSPGPEATGVGGSSLGGLVSLHLAREYPEVFGRCAALSPSLWWDREFFLRSVLAGHGWPEGVRLWLDFGDREGSTRASRLAGVARTRALAKHLAKSGLTPERDFRHREIAGGTHDEASWHGRLDEVLRFLFPPHPSHAH